MGEGEKKRREEEEKEEIKAKKVWMLGFWYGTTNLVYELYYESHGFCMGF